MCGVIVVDAGRSRSTNFGCDANVMIIAWIVMIIWSSINFPTVICLPTVCYFSREKPLVKPTAPGSLSHIIRLCDLLFFCIYFQIYQTKNTKIPCYVLFLFILFGIRSINLLQFIHVYFAYLGRRYPKGIDNPFNTPGYEYLLFVCKCCLRCVAWFSDWFDNLGFITKGNTYLCCATSSLPLWGNTDVVLADRSFLAL